MKRGIKTYLGIGAIAIGVGIILMIAGTALGGAKRVTAGAATINISEEVNGVTSLDFDIPYGEVILKNGNQFQVEVMDMLEGDYTSSVNNGVWKIKGNQRGSGIQIFDINIPFLSFGKGGYEIGTNYNPKVYVTIPENIKFEDIEIVIGAGSFEAEELNAEETMKLEVGAGEIIVNKLNAGEKATFENGAGKIKVNNASVNELKIDCGVGDVVFRGYVEEKANAECGIGSIKLELENNLSDCYFSVDKGIGNVTINNNKANAENKGNKNAKTRFDLECGIGEIKVTTN